MVRYNQRPERIEPEPIKGRPFRSDEPRRNFAPTSGAPGRPVAAHRPHSISHSTRLGEFVALFVLGMLGGVAAIVIAFLGC
jgi:hypothetical protein